MTIMRRRRFQTYAFHFQITKCFFERDTNNVFHKPNYRLYLPIRFHVGMCLFCYGSQMTSKCGENYSVAYEAQSSLALIFLAHFDVFCDFKQNRLTATWNLFVFTMKKQDVVNSDVIYASVFYLCKEDQINTLQLQPGLFVTY